MSNSTHLPFGNNVRQWSTKEKTYLFLSCQRDLQTFYGVSSTSPTLLCCGYWTCRLRRTSEMTNPNSQHHGKCKTITKKTIENLRSEPGSSCCVSVSGGLQGAKSSQAGSFHLSSNMDQHGWTEKWHSGIVGTPIYHHINDHQWSSMSNSIHLPFRNNGRQNGKHVSLAISWERFYKSFMQGLAHRAHSSVAATGLVGWEGPHKWQTQTHSITENAQQPPRKL